MKKRNRIVIDFNQPSAARPVWSRGRSRTFSSHGAGRVLIAIAVTLFLIFAGVIVGGYLWWRSFQRSPAYSLAVLTETIQ